MGTHNTTNQNKVLIVGNVKTKKETERYIMLIDWKN